MAIKNEPLVRTIGKNDRIWNQTFNLFTATVYVPHSELPGEIINYGYSAPYFLVLTDKAFSDEEAAAYAEEKGLKQIAAEYSTSVVFINPLNEGGWKTATEETFKEIIENSKIHQYYKDGYAILISRFFHTNDGYAIRGAIFRTCLIGKGDGADYIAKNLLKKVDGAGLWGPAVITPTTCVLENLSVTPDITIPNMPVVSVANSDSINSYIKEKAYDSLIQPSWDFLSAYNKLIKKFLRWGWVGDLQLSPDFEALNMTEEAHIVDVNTSEDNDENKGNKTHKTGFLAYYNNNLFDKGPVPLVMCFHGGGDSAKHIAQVSAWYKVCHDHNFLLVCIENHIESTATETQQIIEYIKSKYNVDSTRIYATGFSMGGIKTWDMYQEYPTVFAALAPMCATYEPGLNVYGKPSRGINGSGKINNDQMVPLFYAGGEMSPLPELPEQSEKCCQRLKYVLRVNKCNKKYTADFNQKALWSNPVLGIDGDSVQKIKDDTRGSILTLNYFTSEDGNCYTVIGSVDNQEHECRYHTCEYAWRFISQFRRLCDGTIQSNLKDGANVLL